jgi:predicted DCC family thiol-disulfide oxidoreductase YuxK
MLGWHKNGWSGGQYSLWRVLLGLMLLAFSIQQLVQSADDIRIAILASVSLGLSILVLVGCFDGPAAALLATLTAGLILAGGDLSASLWPLVANLILHAIAPPAPFGSWMARGRIDPSGGWQLPAWLHSGSWLLLLIATLTALESGPAEAAWSSGGNAGLAIRVVAVIATLLAFSPRTRLLAWLMIGLCWAGIAVGAGGPSIWSLPSMLLLWLLASDPGWIPPGRHRNGPAVSAAKSPADTAGRTWLFYDGNCGLCHRCVRLVLSEDHRDDPIRLAPLGGQAFVETIQPGARDSLPDSIVVVTPDGQVLCQSAAVLEFARLLGGAWRLAAIAARLVPRPAADLAYRVIAAIRHRLFDRPSESCPLLPPELRDRFDLRHVE